MRSRPAIAYLLVSLSLMLATWMVGEPRLRKAAENEARMRMSYQVRNRLEILARRRAKLRDDALFLSRVPPVPGIVRAMEHNGFDPVERTGMAGWRRRLEMILAAYAGTNPEISQLRFIGVADGGREIVRVDRRGDSTVIVPRDGLRRKGDRFHFREAVKLARGEVFISDLDTKNEPGWPPIPILRGGTPVLDSKGRVRGIVVVNIDARPMLDEFRDGLPPPFRPLLVDGDGRFLSPGPPAATKAARWQDRFASAPPDDSAPSWIHSRTSPGSQLVATRRFRLGDSPSSRDWTVCVALPDTALSERTRRSLLTMLEMEGATLALLGLVLYLSMVGAHRRIAFARERSRLGAIVDGSSDAIVGNDATGPVSSWNRAADSMFGIPADRAVGRQLRDLLFPDGGGEVLDQLRSRLLDGEANPTATLEWTDGKRHLVLLVTLSPVRSATEAVSGIATTIRDVTEQEEARRRVLELNANLESQVQERTAQLSLRTDEAMAAGRAKADFLANMSHEIRTPMTAVMGLAQLLENRSRDPGTLEIVRKIRRAGASLLSLIDDILDFSKIEAGRMELDRSEFVLGDVLDNLATIMSSTAGGKEIDLAIGASPLGNARLLGDPHRLGQVLINLTGNAIKFTEKGSVSVDIRLSSRDGNRVVLVFSVKDTGIGIPADKIPQLFSAFTQADTATTRRFGGSGLGLAISRLLVERMGGRIEVESRPGEGSEFRFSVELEIAGNQQPGSSPDLEVLVADDADESRKAIASVTESLGWRATQVRDGEEALEATVGRFSGGNPFDVLLLDWKMPKLDGMDAARQLRSRLDDGTPPIVILATAHSKEELSSLPDAAVVDEILTKPVTGSSLYDAVTRALRRRGGASDFPKDPRPVRMRRLAGARYLVVDDNEANRDLLRSVLEDEGAEVALSENGRLAVEWLRAHRQAVDAVLMDVQMPEMDGYAATREIRSDRGFDDLPVVALSAGVLQSERAAAAAAGMDGFVPKPFEVEELVATLGRLASRGAVEVPAPPATAPESPSDPVIDERRGIALWRTEEAFRSRLARFAEDNARFAEGIASLLEDGARVAACEEIHRFRGVAGALALPRLVGTAKALEIALRSDADGAPSLDDLGTEMESALREIAAFRGSAAPPAGSSGIPPEAGELRALLAALREALDGNDRRRASEALERLGRIPSPSVDEIRRRVQAYEFRAAAAALDALHRELEVGPPEGRGA